VILRRLYLYLVSAASLGVLAAGLALLGRTVLLFAFNDPAAQNSRGDLAVYSAMVLVALPVWGVHFLFARRFAMRDPLERASAVRRAYLYAACLVASTGVLIGLTVTLGGLLKPALDGQAFVGLTTSQAGWTAAVLAAVWWLHSRIAAADRSAVGELGASATMRRWYMYPILLFGLLMLLAGASNVVQIAWTRLVQGSIPADQLYSAPAGQALAGALIWGFHSRTIARNHMVDDRHSTLRALQGFIAVAIAIAAALFGASQILYYSLARTLGVSNPGEVGNNLLAALASPAALLLVYGTAWPVVRRRLAKDAGAQESRDRRASAVCTRTSPRSSRSLLSGLAPAGSCGPSPSTWKRR